MKSRCQTRSPPVPSYDVEDGKLNRGRQRLTEEPYPVAVQDAGNGVLAVAAFAEHLWQPPQVGDGVEIIRRLFAAETAIEIGADGRMPRIAGQLTDAINVIDRDFQLRSRLLRPCLTTNPAWYHHPGVQRRADHGAALDQTLDL